MKRDPNAFVEAYAVTKFGLPPGTWDCSDGQRYRVEPDESAFDPLTGAPKKHASVGLRGEIRSHERGAVLDSTAMPAPFLATHVVAV